MMPYTAVYNRVGCLTWALTCRRLSTITRRTDVPEREQRSGADDDEIIRS